MCYQKFLCTKCVPETAIIKLLRESNYGMLHILDLMYQQCFNCIYLQCIRIDDKATIWIRVSTMEVMALSC